MVLLQLVSHLYFDGGLNLSLGGLYSLSVHLYALGAIVFYLRKKPRRQNADSHIFSHVRNFNKHFEQRGVIDAAPFDGGGLVHDDAGRRSLTEKIGEPRMIGRDADSHNLSLPNV